MKIILIALPFLLSGTLAAAEEAVLTPRTYTVRTTRLGFDPGPTTAAEYVGKNLWVAGGGELWRFDNSGKSYRSGVPVAGARIRGLWGNNGSVIALIGDAFMTVSTSGLVSPLRQVNRAFRHGVVPVRDGYVGWLKEEAHLVYVSDDGEERALSFVPTANVEEQGSDGGEAAEDGDERALGTPGPLPVPASTETVPKDGKLALLDPEHVAYVTSGPYRIYVLGLDGSTRVVEVDESHVIPPETAAASVDRRERAFQGFDTAGSRKYGMRIERVYELDRNIVVERRQLGKFVLTRDHGGMKKGFEFYDTIVLIDFIDSETGKIVERVDKNAVYDLGGFVGFRGKELVFKCTDTRGRVEPSMVFASPR